MTNINIRINTEGLTRDLKKLKFFLFKNVSQEMGRHAEDIKRSLQFSFITKQKFADRGKTASLFEVRSKQSNIYQVMIPVTASHLDSMTPHFVALKPRRKVTQWANKHFGKMTKSGRSRVRWNRRSGNVQYNNKFKSALYVMPDPFVDEGFDKAQSFLVPRLERVVSKTLKEVFT